MNDDKKYCVLTKFALTGVPLLEAVYTADKIDADANGPATCVFLIERSNDRYVLFEIDERELSVARTEVGRKLEEVKRWQALVGGV